MILLDVLGSSKRPVGLRIDAWRQLNPDPKFYSFVRISGMMLDAVLMMKRNSQHLVLHATDGLPVDSVSTPLPSSKHAKTNAQTMPTTSSETGMNRRDGAYIPDCSVCHCEYLARPSLLSPRHRGTTDEWLCPASPQLMQKRTDSSSWDFSASQMVGTSGTTRAIHSLRWRHRPQ